MVRYASDPVKRFEELYTPEPNSGCWLWEGTINNKGYGSFHVSKERHSAKAHRFSFETFIGPIPDDFVIDHKCRTRCCVNPDHLEPVTNDENMRRGHHATKAHCKQGHELQLVPGYAQRICRTCRRAANRRYFAKKRAR